MNARWFALHILVDLLYLAVSPVVLLYLLVASRGFSRQKYRRGLLQKLGGIPARQGSRPCFWIHAVSVGEVRTAAPLIDALRRRYPQWDFDVSVSTYTGFEVARKTLSGVTLFYYPLDPSPVVARAFRRRRPTVVVLIELEIWPNFLLTARRRNVPVYVANGRITARSARRYGYGGAAVAGLFGLVSAYAVQNETYRQRFLQLGVAEEKLRVLGNLKYDQQPSSRVSTADATRAGLGWPRGEYLLLVGGSTHPGEEQTLWSLYLELRREHPGLRLVLVPRHVERLRAGEVESWRPKPAGGDEPVERWSAWKAAAESSGGGGAPLEDRVLIVDTVGELELFYAMADMVFVGGSLIPHGGHNLLEPARLERPVVFGPHFANFNEEAELLLEVGAVCCVADANELREVLDAWLAEPAERSRRGRKALEVAQGLGGATRRHVDWIHAQLDERPDGGA